MLSKSMLLAAALACSHSGQASQTLLADKNQEIRFDKLTPEKEFLFDGLATAVVLRPPLSWVLDDQMVLSFSFRGEGFHSRVLAHQYRSGEGWSIGTDNGYLRALFRRNEKEQVIRSPYRVDDGLWHSLKVSFGPDAIRVDLDGIELAMAEVNEAKKLRTAGPIIFGADTLETFGRKGWFGAISHINLSAPSDSVVDSSGKPAEESKVVGDIVKAKELLEKKLASARQVFGIADSYAPFNKLAKTISSVSANPVEFKATEAQVGTLSTDLNSAIWTWLNSNSPAISVFGVSALKQVFFDEAPPIGSSSVLKLHAARNETENGQVVVFNPTGKEIKASVTLSPFVDENQTEIKSIAGALRRVGHLYAGGNGAGSGSGMRYLRAAPALFPDVLYQDEETAIPANQNRQFYVTVKVLPSTPPGIYTSQAEVAVAGKIKKIPIQVVVHKAVLPEKPTFKLGAWTGADPAARFLGIIPGGPRRIDEFNPGYYEFLGQVLSNFRDHRATVFSDIPTWNFAYLPVRFENGQYIFDFSAWDKYVDFVQNGLGPGGEIVCVGLPQAQDAYETLLRLGRIDSKDKPRAKNHGDVVVSDASYLLSGEPNVYYTELLHAVSGHLSSRNLLERVHIKVMDEPPAEELPAYNKTVDFVKATAPSLKLDSTIESAALTPEVHTAIVTSWGLWTDAQSSLTQQSKGQEIWKYNNYKAMLDLDLLHTRIDGFLCFKYGIKGYMHWAYLFQTDPWRDTNTHPFGPGEGYLVYLSGNPQSPILDSIRWEQMRDMAEDYDLLTLYESLGGDAKAYCDQLVKHFTVYEIDSDKFDMVRISLLEALDKKL